MNRAAAAVGASPGWLATLILLSIATIFAGNHVAARLAFDHGVSVPAAIMVRSAATAAVVALLIVSTGGRFASGRATLGRALVIGGLLSLQSYCLYSAVARIPVALALLAFNVFPFLLGLISWAAGGERPRRRTLIAMGVVLIGLVFALDVTGWVGGFERHWVAMGVGVAFALTAALVFAAALYLTTRWLGQVDGRLRTVITMGTVALLTGAAGMLTDGFRWPADTPGWVGLGLLTILYGTGITGVFIVLPRIGAVNNSPALNFEPIASLLLAWMILGQAIAPSQVAGALLVVGAIAWLGFGRR